jgi:transcriptional regulator with GAF, ATPase, and Fis domain/tetratricopeptide (TPR) repeat protein
VRATVEESASVEVELVPVAAERDLSLLELDLARLEREPIAGIVATRGVDRPARAYRRAVARGEPLLEWARDKTPEEVRRAAGALVDALAALHETGLMLGGLAAEGVRVIGGNPVIVDLARLSEEAARVEPGGSSATEALVGGRTDRRTDLHGLGKILAALLPGEDLGPLVAPDPHERAATAEAARALLARMPLPESGALPTSRAWHGPLVGRTSGLESVLEAARSALYSPPQESAPGIVLIHGAPGLGRTRFLDEVLVRLAREGVAVARASGTSAGMRPLQVFADLARRIVRPDTRWSERSRVTLSRLGLAPAEPGSGSDRVPAFEPESSEEAREARLQLADAIASLLLEAARGTPLALVIDDIDRCDAGARFVARHLARRLAAARKWLRPGAPRPAGERGRWDSGSGSSEAEHAPSCVLLATTSSRAGEAVGDVQGGSGGHPGEAPDETGAFALDLAALARESYAREVKLEPLDEDSLATIAASLSGDTPSSPRIREVARAAHGNAGLLVESVRAGVAFGSLDEALRARVDALDPRERRLLVALAAIGHEAEASLVASVAGMPLDAAARAALARLVREGLARRSPPGYSLRPVLLDLLAEDAASCRSALGDARSKRQEEDPIAAAEWAAANGRADLLEGTLERALEALGKVRADRRAGALALASADAILARGEREKGVGRLIDAGAAFLRAGNLELAQEAILRATGPLASGAHAEVRARAWRILGTVRAALGLVEASHAAFRRARAALARATGEGIERARVLLAETEASLAQGELDLAAERGEAGLKTLRDLAAGGGGGGGSGAEGGAAARSRDEGGAAARSRDEGGAVTRRTVASVRSRLLAILGHVALLRDRPKEAETLLLAALAIDERNQNEAGAARTHQRLGGVALARGDLDGALGHWRGSLEIRERLGDRAGVAHVHSNLSLAAARAGDLARASALLRRSLRIREEMGDRRGRAASLHNLGYVAACRGELEEAVQALEECLALREELGDRWYAGSARNNLGQVLLDLGRAADASRHLEAALEARRALGDRAGEAASLANLSDLALRRGDFPLAIEREALARRMREGSAGPEDSIDQLRRGARLELALGNVGVAVEAAQSAVKLAKQSALPLQEGPGRLLLGEALARSGRLERAKRELEKARAAADRVGDRLTARRAEVELGAILLASGFAEDARALLDSTPVPFSATAREAAPALQVHGPLRAREQLLRARIELARAEGQASLALHFALEAAVTARQGEERDMEWRALRAAQAAAEKEGDENSALDLGAAAQEIVEALLANVPEARREAYLRADPSRAAALRGDPALPALVPAVPGRTAERPRVELRGAGLEDDAPTHARGRPSRAAKRARPPKAAPERPAAPVEKAARRPPTRGGAEGAEPLPLGDSRLGTDLSRADFATVTGLNRRILEEKDVARLYQLLVETAARHCGAERAFLAVFGTSEDEVEVLAARGIDAEELRSSKQRFSRRAAKRAADSGEPVVTADALKDASSKKASVLGQGLRSVLAAPVRVLDGRRGALYLDHRFQMGIFGARELRLVEAIADQCALAIGRAALEARVRERSFDLEPPASGTPSRPLGPRPTVEPLRFHGLAGRSAAHRRAIAKLAELARGDSAVLLSGPRGAGKEHAARALHAASRRARGPFVVLDLRDAASAADLAAALLGSPALPEGALGAARGGALLLRSLDAAPLELAEALSRVLDEALARRGRESPRILATTSGPLRAELDALFGPAARIELPSLAARREDVPEVALGILERLGLERGETKTLSAAARDQLQRRAFTGEIRELVACLAAAWARAGSRPEILAEDLPPARRA